jgi:hypothetical protein
LRVRNSYIGFGKGKSERLITHTSFVDVAQQILDLYIFTSTSSRNDVSQYTKIKIALNEQATNRGPDPIMDDVTRQELKPRVPDWEFDTASNSPLEIVNTNHHTVSYHFSTS